MQTSRCILAVSGLITALAGLALQAIEASEPGPLVNRPAALTEAVLRQQLAAMPEIGLDQAGALAFYTESGRGSPSTASRDLPIHLLEGFNWKFGRDQLAMLPWRPNADRQTHEEHARSLEQYSVQLRAWLQESVPRGGVVADATQLRERFSFETPSGTQQRSSWRRPLAARVLMQLLQVEPTAIRFLLVDRLAMINGPESTDALARLAIYDLSPSLRQRAMEALAQRPRNEYRKTVLSAFRSPWTAPADHAANLIVTLRLAELSNDLARLAKVPNPALPFSTEVGGQEIQMIREVVRINHLCNCVVCHPMSSLRGALIPGQLPMPGHALPKEASGEASGGYGKAKLGLFVRADVTFLRQDFSVVLPVPNPDKWPAQQRYDFLIRTRPLTSSERNAFLAKQREGNLPTTWPQREAARYALQMLGE